MAVTIEHQRLKVGEAAAASGPSALPYPGVRRFLFSDAQEGVAHLRKNVHVLVAVDKIRRPAKSTVERIELFCDFSCEHLGLQRPQVRS